MRREHTGVQEWPPNSGRYRIDYRDAEGRRRREVIGPDKRLAIRVYNQRRDEILLGRHRPPKRERKTFSEVMAEYLDGQRGMVTARTLDNNRVRAGILKPLLGHELIDKIDARLLSMALAKINDREEVTSGGTVNNYRALLSTVFNFALAAKYIEVNPVNAKTVKTYPQSKGRRRYLTADEEEAIRSVIRQRCPYRELEFDLALFTGLRKTEQYTAKWAKVDLDHGRMTVMGKSRGHIVERTIPLNDVAADTLKKLYLASGGSPYVIPVRNIGRRSRKERDGRKDERTWFDDVVEAAGVVDFKWHDIRHTFGSRQAMAGVPLVAIQQLMGHSSLRSTMIYLHLAPDHLQDQLKKVVDTRNLMVTKKDTRDSAVLQIDDKKVG